MIEKLSEYKITSRDGSFINVECNTKIINTLVRKINELVDAVNELQEMLKSCDNQIGILAAQIAKLQHDNSEKANYQENVQDKFAEQRKWIGCVCRFWFDNPDNTVLDYLGKIQTGENGIEYYGKETYDWFPHCEPVKPDDDIIYKGNNNE